MVFKVGGDGKGKLVCERLFGPEINDPDGLDDNERTALEILAAAMLDPSLEGQTGLTFGEWHKRTGLSKGTFDRCRKSLGEKDLAIKTGDLYRTAQ